MLKKLYKSLRMILVLFVIININLGYASDSFLRLLLYSIQFEILSEGFFLGLDEGFLSFSL